MAAGLLAPRPLVAVTASGDDSLVGSSGELLGHGRRGRGRPTVFVHGWLTGGAIWKRVLDTIAPGDTLPFEAIVPDLRGSGQTGGTASADLADHVADLWALLDSLHIEGTVDVVGHSMGGAIATLMAVSQPERVRRLVLVSPVPPGGFPLPDRIFANFDAVGGDATALRRFLAPQIPATDLDWMVELCARTDRASAQATLRAWTGADFADRARALPLRPRVVAGSRDPFLGPEVLRRTVVEVITGATLAEVPGGHYPMLDAAQATAEQLEGALSEAG